MRSYPYVAGTAQERARDIAIYCSQHASKQIIINLNKPIKIKNNERKSF